MTQELSVIFSQASKLAAAGEYKASLMAYSKFLLGMAACSGRWAPEDVDSAVRSASFNLGQVYNHLGRFSEALEKIDDGLSRSPSRVGRAIGFAARGEALCGLGRIAEGQGAFKQAIQAHPLLGPLNAADSMTRVSSENMLDSAAELLSNAETLLMKEEPAAARKYIAELYTVRGKVFARRGGVAEAKQWFEKALLADPTYEDAKLQIRNLPSSGNVLSRLFGASNKS